MKWIMLYVLMNSPLAGNVYDAWYQDDSFKSKEECEGLAHKLKAMFEAAPDAVAGTLVCYGVVIDQSSVLDVKAPTKAPTHPRYRKPVIDG